MCKGARRVSDVFGRMRIVCLIVKSELSVLAYTEDTFRCVSFSTVHERPTSDKSAWTC